MIGDGALTGGLAYEALNNLGHSGRHAVIVLNDNGRCYAPTVSRLTAVGEPWPIRRRSSGPSGSTTSGRSTGTTSPRSSRCCATRRRGAGPVVVHVLTRKGEGYLPAETDEEKRLHDVGAFDPETGVPVGANGSSYTGAFSAALIALAESRPEIVALTAGMPGSTGLLPFADRFPDRCFDVGIAEQHAVTAAAGMAMRGLRPVVAVYSTFLSRAWDQIVYDVGLHALPVVFCVDRAGITGDDGPSHHGLYDLALLTKVPGLTLFAPSSYEEVAVMLEEAMRITSGPVALRWPKTAARHAVDATVGHGRNARRVRDRQRRLPPRGRQDGRGRRGSGRPARSARDVRATVWDVRTIPPDPKMLADARTHTPRGHRRGRHRRGRRRRAARGRARRAGGGRLRRRPRSRSAPRPRTCPHGKPAALLANLGLDGPGIAATVAKLLDARA